MHYCRKKLYAKWAGQWVNHEYCPYRVELSTLHWRYNDHDGVSNHQPHGCLLSRLFRRRSRKTSKLRVTGLWVENSPGPVNSSHKGPVTRKMFPFDDVIMYSIHWPHHVHSFAAFRCLAINIQHNKTRLCDHEELINYVVELKLSQCILAVSGNVFYYRRRALANYGVRSQESFIQCIVVVSGNVFYYRGRAFANYGVRSQESFIRA